MVGGLRSRWPRLQRVLRLLPRIRETVPLTFAGAAVLGAGLVCLFHFGTGRMDLVLFVVGVMSVCLVTLSAVFCAFGAWLLRRRISRRAVRGGEPFDAECGYPFRTGFGVREPRVPMVRIGLSWVDPEAELSAHRFRGESRRKELREQALLKHRCSRDSIVRRITVADPFGFARVSFRLEEQRRIRFLPAKGALNQVHMVHSMAAGDTLPHPEAPAGGERVDMRRYVAGDPIRFVLWKIFARSRELMVRAPERAVSPVQKTVAYLVCGPGDEPAAGAARVAVESGGLGEDWVLGVDGYRERATETKHALELLSRSGEFSEDKRIGATGLRNFLHTASPTGIGRAVVFVPAVPGTWLSRTLDATRGEERRVEFVVCVDGIHEPQKQSWLRRLAYEPTYAATRRESGNSEFPYSVGDETASNVKKVIETLSRTRCRVWLINRVAGAVYGEEHQRALMGGVPAAQSPETDAVSRENAA